MKATQAEKSLHFTRGQTQFCLYGADCVQGMMQIDAQSVDVVVTSPPYNLGISYNKYNDKQDREQYLDWCVQWATQVQRILKEDGSFFLNIAGAPSNPMLPHEIAIRFRDLFRLQNTIHWIKSISIEREGEVISSGHFKPISSERFITDCHEYVFHFTHQGNTKLDRLSIGVPYADKSNITRWGHTKGKDKRCRGNTWFIPYKTIHSRDEQRPHPATFPIELAEQCIKLHGRNGHSIVLDPFLGIGTAAIAAKRCQVQKFLGFEIDASYLSVATERINEVE